MSKLIAVRSYRSGEGLQATLKFVDRIYPYRGLPLQFRQHLRQELARMHTGEITDIRITAEGTDARYKS